LLKTYGLVKNTKRPMSLKQTLTTFEYDPRAPITEAIKASAECFERDGFVIFENVLTEQNLDVLRGALEPYMADNITGRNDFEGVKSNRVYALMAKGKEFAELALHPLALEYAEAELGKSCLLSAMLAIRLHPGESVQPWHTDDGHIEIPFPRPAYGISTFWALDDTTDVNGATEILPGSHLWATPYDQMQGSIGDEVLSTKSVVNNQVDPGAHPNAVKALLPAGSLIISKGTLWHRGGANKSDRPRTIITPQYCSGWARQLENQLLAVPRDIAKTLPSRAQELLGYSIHPPFMGYVNGVHPNKHL